MNQVIGNCLRLVIWTGRYWTLGAEPACSDLPMEPWTWRWDRNVGIVKLYHRVHNAGITNRIKVGMAKLCSEESKDVQIRVTSSSKGPRGALSRMLNGDKQWNRLRQPPRRGWRGGEDAATTCCRGLLRRKFVVSETKGHQHPSMANSKRVMSVAAGVISAGAPRARLRGIGGDLVLPLALASAVAPVIILASICTKSRSLNAVGRSSQHAKPLKNSPKSTKSPESSIYDYNSHIIVQSTAMK